MFYSVPPNLGENERPIFDRKNSKMIGNYFIHVHSAVYVNATYLNKDSQKNTAV